MMLFHTFRRYCRERAVDHVLSVAIVSGQADDRARLASLTRFVKSRVELATERGRPAAGYEIEPPTAQELEGAALEPAVPPMLKLLAQPRTTLASEPAYCRRFHTFNFLLTTSIGASA